MPIKRREKELLPLTIYAWWAARTAKDNNFLRKKKRATSHIVSISNHWFSVSCMGSIVEDVLSMAKGIKTNF